MQHDHSPSQPTRRLDAPFIETSTPRSGQKGDQYQRRPPLAASRSIPIPRAFFLSRAQLWPQMDVYDRNFYLPTASHPRRRREFRFARRRAAPGRREYEIKQSATGNLRLVKKTDGKIADRSISRSIKHQSCFARGIASIPPTPPPCPHQCGTT